MGSGGLEGMMSYLIKYYIFIVICYFKSWELRVGKEKEKRRSEKEMAYIVNKKVMNDI